MSDLMSWPAWVLVGPTLLDASGIRTVIPRLIDVHVHLSLAPGAAFVVHHGEARPPAASMAPISDHPRGTLPR